MITDDMTDWHQTNKQNKTIKQLAAAWIHQSPTTEIISPAGNQIFKEEYKHLLLVSTTVKRKAANRFFENSCEEMPQITEHTAD